MKTSNRNKLICLALTGSFSLFGASNALAAAGDNIANRATLSYDVGTVNQTDIESGSGAGNSTPGLGAGNDTDFLEDRIINFTVTREGASVQVVPGGAQQAIPYLVDNTGNGTHGFLLAGVHNSGALDPHGSAVSDDFTPTTIETWVDVDDNGIFLPATDNVAFIASMTPAAANVRVFVVSDIPLVDDALNPLVNGDIAVMSLVAQATGGVSTGIAADAIVADDNSNTSPGGTFTNTAAVVAAGVAATNPDAPATMETVFNDTAFTDPVTGITIDATGGNDADQNAQQSSYSSYTIQSASLTVTKASVALWDPINLATSPKSVPGGYVRYTITIANAVAAADADLTDLQDVLTAALDLDPDFGDGTAANNPTNAAGDGIRITHVDNAVTNFCTGVADADGCDYTGGAGGTIDVDINAVMGAADAQLSAGESLTIEFNVIVQ